MVTEHGPVLEPPPEPPDELGSAWEPFRWGCLFMIPAVPLAIVLVIALSRLGLSGQVASSLVGILVFLAMAAAIRWRYRRRFRLKGWARRDISTRGQRRNLKLGLILLPFTFFTFREGPLGLPSPTSFGTWAWAPTFGVLALGEAYEIIVSVRGRRWEASEFERLTELDAAACGGAAAMVIGTIMLLTDRYWRPVSAPLLFVAVLFAATMVRRARILLIDRAAERSA